MRKLFGDEFKISEVVDWIILWDLPRTEILLAYDTTDYLMAVSDCLLLVDTTKASEPKLAEIFMLYLYVEILD